MKNLSATTFAPSRRGPGLPDKATYPCVAKLADDDESMVTEPSLQSLSVAGLVSWRLLLLPSLIVSMTSRSVSEIWDCPEALPVVLVVDVACVVWPDVFVVAEDRVAPPGECVLEVGVFEWSSCTSWSGLGLVVLLGWAILSDICGSAGMLLDT